MTAGKEIFAAAVSVGLPRPDERLKPATGRDFFDKANMSLIKTARVRRLFLRTVPKNLNTRFSTSIVHKVTGVGIKWGIGILLKPFNHSFQIIWKTSVIKTETYDISVGGGSQL